jgi:hypothetical protein
VDGEAAPGISLIELLWNKFTLGPEEEKFLTERFLAAVSILGQWVAGDEKLFKWTGESQWVRMCPQKEDELGLWNYELCARLSNGLSYLLYVRSHLCETSLGGGVQCASVVQDWGKIVKEHSTDDATILVADSYYLDRAGRQILHGIEVPFICAVQACRFNTLAKRARKIAHHAGKTALLYCWELHEMFVTHWYPEPLGQKFVLSNAFTASEGNTRKGWVPGCDDFSIMFNVCDQYNRSLHEKSWPHRCQTAPQQQHNFLFTCILMNTYHAYLDAQHLRPENLDYKSFGEQLADELYTFACGL